jgi:hypothetical protein
VAENPPFKREVAVSITAAPTKTSRFPASLFPHGAFDYRSGRHMVQVQPAACCGLDRTG